MLKIRLRGYNSPLLCVISVVSLLIPQGKLFAHDAPAIHGQQKAAVNKGKKSNWKGNVSLSLTSNVGNTNTGVLKSSAKAVYNTGFSAEQPFRHTISARVTMSDRSAGRGKDRIETKNQKGAGYRVDYFLSEKQSLRGLINYQSDNLAKLDSLVYAAVGYQHSLLETKNHKISAGGGIGYLDVEYTDNTPSVSGAAGRLSLDYVGKVTENFTVSQKLAVMGKSGFTQQLSVTRLEYALSEKSSIALENEVEHFADAPITAIDNTDSTTGLKFIYKF